MHSQKDYYRDLTESSNTEESLEVSLSSLEIWTNASHQTRLQEWRNRIYRSAQSLWSILPSTREALEYQGFSYDRIRSQWKRQTFKWITQIVKDDVINDDTLLALFDAYLSQCQRACHLIVNVFQEEMENDTARTKKRKGCADESLKDLLKTVFRDPGRAGGALHRLKCHPRLS